MQVLNTIKNQNQKAKADALAFDYESSIELRAKQTKTAKAEAHFEAERKSFVQQKSLDKAENDFFGKNLKTEVATGAHTAGPKHQS